MAKLFDSTARSFVCPLCDQPVELTVTSAGPVEQNELGQWVLPIAVNSDALRTHLYAHMN